MFFFSSRRRHTRLQGDWSSDVCSSDLLCSFVPVMAGWHPLEVPAPHAPFNVDSDELMFFCNPFYGAREGVVEEGSFTFHPGSTPPSPQGNAAPRSPPAPGEGPARPPGPARPVLRE